jgi:hypothetical protein
LDLDALRYLQLVYRGQIQAEGQRMRAAIACLPFETPRLSIMANIESKDFGLRLEAAIKRSGLKLIEHEPAKPREIEAPPDTNLSKPMIGTDRKMRRL